MFWHSDGTHSLQRIHWWISEVLLNFSKETNLSTFWMVSTFSANFHFWVNYSFEEILFIKKKEVEWHIQYMQTLPSLRKQWTCCRHHEYQTVKQRKACCHFFYWTKISYIWHINPCYFRKKCDHLQYANHHDLQWPMKKCDFLQQIGRNKCKYV